MTSATLALRQALAGALNAHAPLVAVLGGPKTYDVAPRAAAFPYVTLGDAQGADWSTATSRGVEHQVTLHVWSQAAGQKEAHVVAGELLAAMETLPVSLAGHRLINARFSTLDIRREADGKTWHGVVRFRAVTEEI